jgi:hypothetical protein
VDAINLGDRGRRAFWLLGSCFSFPLPSSLKEYGVNYIEEEPNDKGSVDDDQ